MQEQEAKLSAEVGSLKKEVASLKASLSKAQQQATELDQRLDAQMAQARSTVEALQKQAESLRVGYIKHCDPRLFCLFGSCGLTCK